jgi:alkylation response protein AidB-like acyl-CoA dehydrogenase
MDKPASSDLQAFQNEVATWIAGNLPEELRFCPHYPEREMLRPWHELLYRQGWIAPAWSRGYGGMGATIDQRKILLHELIRFGAPNLISAGINFIGPLLMRFGSPEQKEYHLPRILSGEIQWAQGYSEPEAGSDLASIRTRAKFEDDSYIVNGHKVWQTLGHSSDWMITMVRTDPDAPRREGISLLLIDLASEGVTVNKIKTINNETEFSEVLLENVRVPKSNLVGAPGDGWRLANAMLIHERLAGGSPELSLAMLKRIRLVIDHSGMADDAFMDRLTSAEIDLMALEAAYWQAIAELEAQVDRQSAVPYLKYYQTKIQQELADLLIIAAGSDGCRAEAAVRDTTLPIGNAFLTARRATIFGGTREIQLSIIARQSLGLPSG